MQNASPAAYTLYLACELHNPFIAVLMLHIILYISKSCFCWFFIKCGFCLANSWFCFFTQHVICALENACFATFTLNVAYTFWFPTPGVFTLYVACTLKFAFASFRLYVAPTLGNIFPASLIACDSCLSKSFFYCL